VQVAVADLEGEGVGAIIAAAGPGGRPRVQAARFDGTTLFDDFFFDASFRGGVYVGGSAVTTGAAVMAPPLDLTVATTLAAAAEFLYSGTNPIQVGVAPGAIVPERAAILRGRVTDRSGVALAGVTVSVLNRSEYGQTRTRANGQFDLAISGGETLTLQFERAGYLLSQRTVVVVAQDYTAVPSVVLVTAEGPAVTVDLAGTTTNVQVVGSAPVADANGQRQTTLLVTPGTTATLTPPDGGAQPAGSLTLRATELTVGTAGPAAMTGTLPATSGYTFAAEFSADGVPAGSAVEFSQPLPAYVDNFLGFPVGGAVPVGFYDRGKGLWVGTPNGRVVEVKGQTDGLAEIDTDGVNGADTAAELDAFGISVAERRTLAEMYAPAGTISAARALLRFPLTRLGTLDCNWPQGPPAGATAPELPAVVATPLLDDPNLECGSDIGVENQSLGENIGGAGTPFTLRYQSDRDACGGSGVFVADAGRTHSAF
jgi:hypothetical protein